MADDEEPPRRVVRKRVVKKAASVPTSSIASKPAESPSSPTSTTSRTQGARESRSTASRSRTTPRTSTRARLRGLRQRLSRTVPSRPRLPSRLRRPSRPRLLPRPTAPALPELPVRAALAVSGAAVGLITVGLTVLAMTVFDLVRGTSTGNGLWGFLGLCLVIVAAVAVGAYLLTSLRVPYPRLTALLGMLLVLIVVLGFVLDVVFSAWMWLAIPVLSAVAYLGAHWVLSRTEG